MFSTHCSGVLVREKEVSFHLFFMFIFSESLVMWTMSFGNVSYAFLLPYISQKGHYGGYNWATLPLSEKIL